MTDDEVFYSDYKEYDCNGRQYAIGCINAYDEAGALELAERMKAVMPSTLAASVMDMAFALITIYHDDLSVSYIVPSDQAAAEVIEAAFGDTAEFGGTSYVLIPRISRKQVLVPAITDILEAYPKE